MTPLLFLDTFIIPTITIGDHNRLASDANYDYTYDDEGNLERRDAKAGTAFTEYTWDHRNRLIGLKNYSSPGTLVDDIGYRYNADDQLIERIAGVDTEHYVYEGSQRVLTLKNDGDLKHRKTWGLGVDQLLVDEVFDASGQLDETLWAATDHLGSVNQLLDNTGAVAEHREYDSFGAIDQVFDESGTEVGSSALQSDTAFAGRTWDNDAQLYYNRARWYEPESGRFIGEDPAQDGTNWYAYAGNDPINFHDPTGLNAAGNPLAVIGNAIGSTVSDIGTNIGQFVSGFFHQWAPSIVSTFRFNDNSFAYVDSDTTQFNSPTITPALISSYGIWPREGGAFSYTVNGSIANYKFDIAAFSGDNAALLRVKESVAESGAANSEEIVRYNDGVWGKDTDGDGWSDSFFGGFFQSIAGVRYGEATLKNDDILQAGDFERLNGGNAHEALNAAKIQAAEVIANTATDTAIEVATAGTGGLISKADDVNDIRKFQKARKGVPNRGVRPSVSTGLSRRVTGELPAGHTRTAAENAQARDFFKNNRKTAEKWWSDRNGGKPWPKNATHAEHPRALTDGGDPLFVEPGFGGPSSPHMVPGRDGLTDFQRWGRQGGRPRN